MLTLFIGNKNYSSWSLRPWTLLTELNIHFKEELRPFSNENNWENFRKFSPTGTVPLLIDDSAKHAIKVWDSLAIMEYLAESNSHIWPEPTEARTWARCVSAEMHSGFFAVRNQCPMSVGHRVAMQQIDDSLNKNCQRLDEIWNEGLQRFQGPFLTGEKFTAVDAFFTPIAFRYRTYRLPFSQASTDYLERLLTLDSMQAWEQAALKEVWREPQHEIEISESGEITDDFRETS